MAGYKHRYLIIKVDAASEKCVPSSIKNAIIKNIKTDFGDVVLGLMDCLEVAEYHENLGIAVIKCNLAIYKYVCYTLVAMGKINKMSIRLQILFTSGILKKAKIAYLKEIKNKEAAELKMQREQFNLPNNN
jgi:RNase P/RNase MRP subunit POP5